MQDEIIYKDFQIASIAFCLLSIEKSGGGGAVGASQTFAVENGTMYNFVAEVDKGSCNPASSIDVRIKNDLGVVIPHLLQVFAQRSLGG